MEFLVNRMKALVLFLLGIFKRAMCCLRRRRRSSCDSIPLSTVGVAPNTASKNTAESEQWDEWEENPVVVVPDKPVNPVQAKIEQYRQQASMPPEVPEEQHPNFFEDMTPKITRQTKILVKDKTSEDTAWNSSKFAVMNEPLPSNELGEWEDNVVGWEEETSKELQKTLREQKKQEREQRLLEQQQKKIERSSRPQPLGAKLTS